ncbi:MAG: DUF2062 domain-containing protein [Geobacter sp.]|nr:DUF2062 domain-containing protein [Geobacter sp.]
MLDRKNWKNRIYDILSMDSHPAHISAGFAVGVFISFTPFFGFHMAIAIAAAFLLRLNKLTCITGAWVNTPLTVVPVLAISYRLGRLLRGLPPQELHIKTLDWQHLKIHAASLLVGTSVTGFVAAVTSYFLMYWLVVRFRKRDEAMEEEVREMEETGEEVE